jgi:putative transcriptional regulator
MRAEWATQPCGEPWCDGRWARLIAVLACVGVLLGGSARALQGSRVTDRLAPGVFLYSIPEMRDPNFAESVVVLLRKKADGAAGLIINRPTDILLSEALPDIAGEDLQLPLYLGGPVAPDAVLALVRGERPSEGASRVLDGVFSISSLDDIEAALGRPDAESQLRVYAGYAGWGPGQLEGELRLGHWVVAPGKAESIFARDPSEVWPEVFSLLQRIEVRYDAVRGRDSWR